MRSIPSSAALAALLLGGCASAAEESATPATDAPPPPTSVPYVVSDDIHQIERGLRPTGRRDLVTGPGVHSTAWVQAERDRINEAEIHESTDDYHIAMEGSTVYILGGTLKDPRRTAPGEWRASAVEGGRRVEVDKGDVVFIPRGTAHQRDTRGRDYSVMLIKVLDRPVPPTP